MHRNIVVKKVGDTELEITGEIEAEHFESFRAKAIKHLQADLELPGFRKGHVPDNMVEEKFSSKILEEMAELALNEAYPKIIDEQKLDAIDRPKIGITKLAKGNPLAFKIHQTVVPEIVLPDYKKIVKNLDFGKKLENEKDDKEKHRVMIIDAIVKETKITVPEILIERQVEAILKHYNESGPEARVAVRREAERYIRAELVLRAIAQSEKLESPAKVLEMLGGSGT